MNPALIQQFYQTRDALLAEYPELFESDGSEMLLLDTIDGMDGLQDALRWMIRQAREREANADACKAMAKEITSRASRLTAGADKLRDSVKQVMAETGIKKLSAPDFTATLANGRPSVVITDVDALPEVFKRINVEADKSKIKQYLENGGTTPGAMLSNSGMTLTVRTA